MQYPISQLPGRQTNADIAKARATAISQSSMGKSRAAFVSEILTGIPEELRCHLLTEKIPTGKNCIKIKKRGQKATLFLII